MLRPVPQPRDLRRADMLQSCARGEAQCCDDLVGGISQGHLRSADPWGMLCCAARAHLRTPPGGGRAPPRQGPRRHNKPLDLAAGP